MALVNVVEGFTRLTNSTKTLATLVAPPLYITILINTLHLLLPVSSVFLVGVVVRAWTFVFFIGAWVFVFFDAVTSFFRTRTPTQTWARTSNGLSFLSLNFCSTFAFLFATKQLSRCTSIFCWLRKYPHTSGIRICACGFHSDCGSVVLYRIQTS